MNLIIKVLDKHVPDFEICLSKPFLDVIMGIHLQDEPILGYLLTYI